MANYQVEIKFKGRTVGHNIFYMTQNLRYKRRRNGATSIDFALNTQQFHEWCRRRGEEPQNVLWEMLTEIVVRRNGRHVASGYVAKLPGNMNKNNSTIQVQVDGFLNLLHNRRVTAEYSNMYTADIFKAALNETQAQPYGDMGFTIDDSSYLGKSPDRQDTYERTELYDLLVNRSAFVNDPYDFEINERKVIKFYKDIGAKRYDTIITYPPEFGTIGAVNATFEHSAANLANRIIALGSGDGDEVVKYVANDYASQEKYGVAEDVVTFNGIKLLDTLKDRAEATIKARSEVLVLPKVTVHGQQFDIGSHNVGDSVIVRHKKYGLYQLEDLYRIEEMDVDVSNTGDDTCDLTLDNFTVPADE